MHTHVISTSDRWLRFSIYLLYCPRSCLQLKTLFSARAPQGRVSGHSFILAARLQFLQRLLASHLPCCISRPSRSKPFYETFNEFRFSTVFPAWQSEQKRFLQQHKTHQESYLKVVSVIKKQRKKNRASRGGNVEKEIRVRTLRTQQGNRMEVSKLSRFFLPKTAAFFSRRRNFVLHGNVCEIGLTISRGLFILSLFCFFCNLGTVGLSFGHLQVYGS